MAFTLEVSELEKQLRQGFHPLAFCEGRLRETCAATLGKAP